MKLGVGLQYAFGPGFMVLAEGERYRVSDATGGRGRVNLHSMSPVFPFGRAPAVAPNMAVMMPAADAGPVAVWL